jgi:CheY-like chemotaxis protein
MKLPFKAGFAELAEIKRKKSTKIMVVDDSKIVRHLIISMLDEIGFKAIIESDNPDSTEELLSLHSPAAVLAEWGSPAMPQAINPNIKVIYFITPDDFTKNQTQIAALGHACILKPFDAKALKTKFQQLGIKKSSK